MFLQMLQGQGRLAPAQRFLQFCVCAHNVCKLPVGRIAVAGDSCCDSDCVDVSGGELSCVLWLGGGPEEVFPPLSCPSAWPAQSCMCTDG